MASKRAQLLSGFLKVLRYGGKEERPVDRVTHTRKARRTLRLLTTPQPLGTRSISASIPGVKAVWHVGPKIHASHRILYFHGGGYTAGSPTTHRHFTSTLARLTGIPVLSVDYRLAPENPFPAAREDARAAYAWIVENGPEGASPAEKVFIGGDSAGGGLTMSLAMLLRDEGARRPDALFMFSPWLDLTITADSIRRIGHLDVMLNVPHARRWVENYAPGMDPKTPGISPLFGDFRDLPTSYFCVGGREIVLDDTLSAIEKAKAAGVRTFLDRNEEMFHVWPLFFHLIPEARESLNKVADFLREASEERAFSGREV